MFRWMQRLAVVAIVSGAAMPGLAVADNVIAGVDLFQTDPGSTWQDFGPTPIPPGFFGPGSDPFTGLVFFGGQPLLADPACPADVLGPVDTIVRRRRDALLPLPSPAQDTVPIEIVALHLVSVMPITVTYSGGMNPEPWSMTVTLSQVQPQPPGQMTIRQLDPSGGTFDSQLPVVPRFTFQRRLDGMTRVLDLGSLGQMIQFGASGIPWKYATPPAGSCTTNFCVNPGALTMEMGLFAQHGVYSVCPEAATSVEEGRGESWGGLKVRYR